MNNRIESLITTIEEQFKSLYGIEISEFKHAITNLNDVNHTKGYVNNWTLDEIDFIVERALMGINYYILNFCSIDKSKYAFPVASFNSILKVLENNEEVLVIYIKKIPVWNISMEIFLKEKEWLK